MLLDFSTYFWISKHLILFETQPTSKGSLLIILHTELEKLENRTELAFGWLSQSSWCREKACCLHFLGFNVSQNNKV